MPTPLTAGRSLLHSHLVDSCWSVESTRDIQNSDESISSIRVLKLSSPLFASSVPPSEATPLLRHRITNESLSWGNFSPCFSDNFFIPCYWEWLEDVLGRNKDRLKERRLYEGLFASLFSYDMSLTVFKAFCELWCHTTNTFCTESGDMSISLWDLRTIGGLSADGVYYEETIPSARELLSAGHGDSNIPATCPFLFSAFHRLCQDVHGVVQLPASEWIRFWFRGRQIYTPPPCRDNRKRLKAPTNTSCPSGLIMSRTTRTKREKDPFVTLGIPEALIEETYLAALISCWLCSFVLPTEAVCLIHPTVFVAASRIAHGECLNLAIPALANIYRGLNRISTARTLNKLEVIFPIHYVYGWLGTYFQTYFDHPHLRHEHPRMVRFSGEKMNRTPDVQETRELLRCKDPSIMYSIALMKDKSMTLIDTQSLSLSWRTYLICLRSGFLTLQQGRTIVIEPYFPCKFGRQFGFYQDVLSEPRMNEREGTLQDAARYWYTLTEHVTRSSVTIPACPNKKSTLVTMAYANWWQSARGDLFFQPARKGIAPPRRAVKVGVDDDASALVVTSGKARAHKPTMRQRNEHALSPAELRKEGGDSSSFGGDASPQKSRSCSPGKEKIEALRGLGIKASISGVKNLSGSKGNPDSVTKLRISKDKPNTATSSLKSESKAKGDNEGQIAADKLKAAFGNEDSEATLTVPIAKPSSDESIEIMPSPVKQVERCPSPTTSVATYLPGKISSGVFSDLALSVKQRFLQQLKKFIPKTETDIMNIRQEAGQIYETLSSFQADYLGLKNTVETYLNEAGEYLRLKAQVDTLNKRGVLLNKLEGARASVEKIGTQFDEETAAIAQAHKRRKLLEADLERAKSNELELQGRLAETDTSLKKAKDDVSAIEMEVANLDVTPQVTAEEIAQVEAAKKRVQELLGTLDA